MKLTLAVMTAASLILLSACHHDDNGGGSPASAAIAPTVSAASTPHPANLTAVTDQQPRRGRMLPDLLAPATAASATNTYQIPPFPISNVAICDQYASEVQRCINKVGNDTTRRAYEDSVKALLQKVTPEPGQRPNEWLTTDCRRGLDSLSARYPQCGVQKQ